MFYIVLLSIYLIWFALIKIKGKFSWHSILSIWFIAIVFTDVADVTLSHMLGLYDLDLKLFADKSTNTKHGIFLSDFTIVPLVALIFSYYYTKFKKWWMPITLVVVMVLNEAFFVYFKYIVYNNFDPLYTATFYVIGAVLLTCYADRFVHYSPPINYTFILYFVTYIIMGFLGAFLGGGMELFLWKPGVFKDAIADNWLVSIVMDSVSGLILCLCLSKLTSMSLRRYAIIALGLSSIIFTLVMHSKGILVYYKWNNVLQILRYSVSTALLIFYDKWESQYRLGKLN